MSRVCLATLLLAFTAACSGSPGAPDVIFRPVAKGSFSSVPSDQRSARIITDQASWTALLTQLQPETAPPSINFSAEMVVVLLTGARPTAGYQVQVEHVIRHTSQLEVVAIEVTPHPSCAVATVVTQPFLAIAVGRINRSVDDQWTVRVGPECR